MSKYKVAVLFLFLISLCSFHFVQASNNTLPLLGKVIYLDPGHGGTDPGAVYKDIEEAGINLAISQKLKEHLEQLGAIVYLTRYDDYDLSVPNTINRKRSDLSRRGNIINRSMCDLYLSIHLNADSSTTWRGAQVFYDDVNPKNEKIAKIMQEELKKGLNTNREYKLTNDIYIFKRIERPGVLIEAGFISNPNERYLLQQPTYQEKISNTIINGVLRYFNEK